MRKIVYDLAQLAGAGLIVAGVAHWSGPAALITAGALVIVFTLVDSGFFRRG